MHQCPKCAKACYCGRDLENLDSCQCCQIKQTVTVHIDGRRYECTDAQDEPDCVFRLGCGHPQGCLTPVVRGCVCKWCDDVDRIKILKETIDVQVVVERGLRADLKAAREDARGACDNPVLPCRHPDACLVSSTGGEGCGWCADMRILGEQRHSRDQTIERLSKKAHTLERVIEEQTRKIERMEVESRVRDGVIREIQQLAKEIAGS